MPHGNVVKWLRVNKLKLNPGKVKVSMVWWVEVLRDIVLPTLDGILWVLADLFMPWYSSASCTIPEIKN